MKTDTTLTKLVAGAILALTTLTPSFAQNDLGASCGCPLVSARTTNVNLSTLADANGELTASNTILTCDKIWTLDKKIYVPSGKSITIQPGTLIKGNVNPGGDPTLATALVISRGGKIFASGTPDCQVVFTAQADNMTGTYGVENSGAWGGLVLLGNATNNLTLGNATSTFGGSCTGSSCFGTGVGTGYVEGFIAADSRNQYGGSDDDDNSGILRYVSVRHAGAKINAAGNELNGLTLASVGRGTTIDHVELISSDDDGIEFFGGTVNVKNIAVLFSNDDMFDWDQGWRGNAQFLFGISLTGAGAPATDNGFEMDNDDQKTNATPLSKPIIYNATLIGNGDANQNVFDNSAHAAINAKEFTGGEIYNSIFANFETGFNMQKTFSAPRTAEAYVNWSPGTDLKVECNTFVNMANSVKTSKSKTSDGAYALAADLTKFSVTDKNDTLATLPGFDYLLTIDNATNVVSDKYDAVPNPAVSTTCTTPANGFFTATNYKGAFPAATNSWLSDWAYTELAAVTNNTTPCPTDINGDGVTDNIDFLQFVGQFNQSCY